MSIFKIIGAFFVGLFNAAKKAYSKLSPEQQDALQAGTGLVAILNDNLAATPEQIRLLIQQRFPNLDEESLEKALFSVLQQFNLTVAENLDQAIVTIQGHLSSLEGKAWAVASHGVAAALSVAFGPKETKVATIVSLLEWVYQHFIKKSTNQ